MPGKEIKGRSKIATYRHGGRVSLKAGTPLKDPLKTRKIKPTLGRNLTKEYLKKIKMRKFKKK